MSHYGHKPRTKRKRGEGGAVRVHREACAQEGRWYGTAQVPRPVWRAGRRQWHARWECACGGRAVGRVRQSAGKCWRGKRRTPVRCEAAQKQVPGGGASLPAAQKGRQLIQPGMLAAR